MTNTSLAYLETVTSPAWTPAAERLLEAMQRGAVLHWLPYGGFVLQLPSGKITKPWLGMVRTPLRMLGMSRLWR